MQSRLVIPYRSELTWAAGLLFALAGCGVSQMQNTGEEDHVRADHQGGVACEVGEVSRKALTLDGGRMAYVEPTVLRGSTNGDFLLAGQYNYQFERQGDGTWRPVKGDSLLGAVVHPDGSARAVQAPFPSARLSGVRAVELDRGAWAVVFAEVPPTVDRVRPDSALQLWYGVIEGGAWTTLEPMPMPTRGTLHPKTASSLVRHEGKLAWAMTMSAPWERSRIILYEFRDGRWSHEQIATSHAQVELSYSDSLGLLLAVVQADPAKQQDSNSLLLWRRDPSWRVLRTVVPGSREQVFHPSVRFTPTDAVASWFASARRPDGSMVWEAHAMQGNLAAADEPVIALGSVRNPFGSPTMVDLSEGHRVWILDSPVESDSLRSIQFLRPDGAGSIAKGSIPNPYVTAFAAAALSRTEVLISGGVLDTANQVLHSSLLRVPLDCLPDRP